jgi:hypothetical protein
MAKPKLALIPSAQGSKFYSVLPSSGVGDFDFTRSGSATRINSQGLIETVANGVSRLNYPLIDGVVKGCPHHILEPVRTNLIQYSEDFSQYSDSLGADIFSNTTISPDGTLNASTIGFGGSDNSRIFISTSTSSSTYIFSLYVKSSTSKKFRFRISDTSGTTFSDDLQTTTKWERFTFEFTGDPSTCAICNSSDAITGSIDIFGFQLEQNSVASSYIPTQGSIQTRVAETASGSGNSEVFNDSEGVLFADISALANDGTSRRISISDGGTSNRVSIEIDETADRLKLFIDSNSLQVDNIGLTNFTKICGKYKANDYSLWVNGFELATLTTSSNVPSGLDRLNFDGGNLSNDFYGNTKQLQYFDTVLTDNELETLTSWVSFQDMAESQLYTIE